MGDSTDTRDFAPDAAAAFSNPPTADAADASADAKDAAKTADAENDAADADSETIVFTDSAARKVRELMEEEGNPELRLRVFIAGGGCSGFQYGFTFDEETAEDDLVLQKLGVTVLIDPMSCQYLVGAEIDYQERLEGSQFVIRNPNVTSTCGCGSSFSV